MTAAPGAAEGIADPGKQGRAAAGIPVVPAFDGYRAFAILGIVFFHLLGASGVLHETSSGTLYRIVEGTVGQLVDVLFILSGFVVFLPTVARRGDFGSVKSFAIRRAARLVPAYWAMLLIMLLVVGVMPLQPPLSLPSAGVVAVHFAFLQSPATYFGTFPIGFGLNGPLWTLSLEVTFYLLLPLVAGWYFRRPLVGLAIAAVITAVWHESVIHLSSLEKLAGAHPSDNTSFRLGLVSLNQFPFFAFSFAAGMTGAWAYVRARERFSPAAIGRWAGRWQLASLAALVLFGWLLSGKAATLTLGAEVGRRSPLIAIGYTGALAALMVSTALGAARWQRPFATPVVRSLGDISYGIYLAHVVILTVLAGHLGFIPGDGSIGDLLALAAIVIPASVFYGYLSARFLEQPIRRWARRFGAKSQDAAAKRLTAEAVS